MYIYILYVYIYILQIHYIHSRLLWEGSCFLGLFKTDFVLQIFRSHFGSFMITILFSQYFTAQPLKNCD